MKLHDLSMHIFSLIHLADPCFQLGSANGEDKQTGGREGRDVRLPRSNSLPAFSPHLSQQRTGPLVRVAPAQSTLSLSPESGDFSCLRAVVLPPSGVSTSFVVP